MFDLQLHNVGHILASDFSFFAIFNFAIFLFCFVWMQSVVVLGPIDFVASAIAELSFVLLVAPSVLLLAILLLATGEEPVGPYSWEPGWCWLELLFKFFCFGSPPCCQSILVWLIGHWCLQSFVTRCQHDLCWSFFSCVIVVILGLRRGRSCFCWGKAFVYLWWTSPLFLWSTNFSWYWHQYICSSLSSKTFLWGVLSPGGARECPCVTFGPSVEL